MRRARSLTRSVLSLDQELHTLRVTAGLAALHASRKNYSDAGSLQQVEVRVFSQWGEDGIVDYLLERTSMARPRCLEIGVGDYYESNTRFLVEIRSAPAVIVDARPGLEREVRRQDVAWRSDLTVVEMHVDRENVSSHVATWAGEGFDVVSIDIDGCDYWVLERIPLDRTSIVVCEYNALFGSERAVAVPYKPGFSRFSEHPSGLYYGASLRAMILLMRERGFTFVGSTSSCVNAFFVRDELASRITFSLPGLHDLGTYCHRLVRDARDSHGRLTFSSPHEQLVTIAGLPVVDVIGGEVLTVADAAKPGST